MNNADETEVALSCSFCKEKFSDVIKSIPDCGNNICGRCYENLKEDVDEASKNYKCVECGERHTLPTNELRDNKALMVALGKIKSTEKLVHPSVKKLRELVRAVEDQMEKLRSFDCKQFIDLECGRLEQGVGDAIESAVDHLKEIEKLVMRQINVYRERCLENLFKKSSEPENTTKQELTELEKEVSEFNARWNNYFTQIEVFESESDIEAALSKTEEFISKMESMEERMRKEALNWEKVVFHVNSQFLKEWKHVGEIEIIVEPKGEIQQEEPKEASNSELSTPLLTKIASLDPKKKTTIQKTTSFTLTGHSKWVQKVLFLPDGRLASCSHDKTIKIWNVENKKELFQLRGHTDEVLSIALLPNGHLASGSSSRERTIKIWDLEQRKEIRTIQAHSDAVVSLRVLKNGNLASYSLADTIKIWNLNSQEDEPIFVMKGHGNTNYLGLQLFGILSNDCLVTCSCNFIDNQKCVLRVWNPNEPNPIKSVPTGFNDVLSLLVLSNDQVALGFEESGTITIIDLNDNALSRTKEKAHDKDVFSLAQLSNGNLVSAGWDAPNFLYWTIKVWNLLDWSLLQTIKTGHSNAILSLSISGDQRFLASGSNDKTIKLWPISTD